MGCISSKDNIRMVKMSLWVLYIHVGASLTYLAKDVKRTKFNVHLHVLSFSFWKEKIVIKIN